MNTKYDGPFTSAFESSVEGIVKQELITYRVKNGMLIKETTTLGVCGVEWLTKMKHH